MKRLVLSSLALSALAAAIIQFSSPMPLWAAGAGHVNGSYCDLKAADGNFYTGTGSLVQTTGGTVNGYCHLTLSTGVPVNQAVQGTYILSSPYGSVVANAVETPSGNADLSLHN